MRHWLPLYEGDGYLHYQGDRLTPAAAPATGRVDIAKVEREARELRAATLRAWFPKAAAWARDKLRYARMREAERYLAQATDLADLERRLAEAERQGMIFNRG